MIITKAAAPMSSQRVKRAFSPSTSTKGVTVTRKLEPGSYDSGNSACTRLRIVATSVRACSSVAPGASRAIMSVMRWVRPFCISALVWCSLMTMFISASIRCGKLGASCSTPTTSVAFPSMRTVFPMIALSPPKRRTQYSRVSTITGGTPVPSSPSLSARPRIGDSPITEK